MTYDAAGAGSDGAAAAGVAIPGVAAVDEALTRLPVFDTLPLSEHAGHLTAALIALTGVLAAGDDPPT